MTIVTDSSDEKNVASKLEKIARMIKERCIPKEKFSIGDIETTETMSMILYNLDTYLPWIDDLEAPNKEEKTLLQIAAYDGLLEQVKLLWESGARNKRTRYFHPLTGAIIFGEVEIAKYLMSVGCTLEESDSLISCITHPRVGIDAIELCLKLGIDPNYNEKTLTYALGVGEPLETIELLLEYGTNCSVVDIANAILCGKYSEKDIIEKIVPLLEKYGCVIEHNVCFEYLIDTVRKVNCRLIEDHFRNRQIRYLQKYQSSESEDSEDSS